MLIDNYCDNTTSTQEARNNFYFSQLQTRNSQSQIASSVLSELLSSEEQFSAWAVEANGNFLLPHFFVFKCSVSLQNKLLPGS